MCQSIAYAKPHSFVPLFFSSSVRSISPVLSFLLIYMYICFPGCSESTVVLRSTLSPVHFVKQPLRCGACQTEVLFKALSPLELTNQKEYACVGGKRKERKKGYCCKTCRNSPRGCPTDLRGSAASKRRRKRRRDHSFYLARFSPR